MTTTTAAPSLRARAAARMQEEAAKREEQALIDACEQAAYLIGTLAEVLREDFGVEPPAVVLLTHGGEDRAHAWVDGIEFRLTGAWDDGTWELLVCPADLHGASFQLLYRRDSRFSRLDPWLRLGQVLAGEKGEPV